MTAIIADTDILRAFGTADYLDLIEKLFAYI